MRTFKMGSALSSHWHDYIWVALRYLTFGTSALLILALIALFALHKLSKNQVAVIIVINIVCYVALIARGVMVKH